MRALVQALLLFLTLGLVGSSAALVQRALALPAPAPLTLTSFRLSMAVGEGRYMSLSDIEAYGRRCGIKLVSKVTGPYLRIEAFAVGDGADPQSSSDNGNGNDLLRTGVGSTEQLIGYCTAFIRPVPFNLLQLDTIQVKNRRQTLGFKRDQWTVDGPGISFIMGSWALRWGWDRGCRRAELLAVKDSELMHKILVRLYESFGFRSVREVGDSSTSVADRLVWGAVGTLMSLDLEPFFEQWTQKMRGQGSE